MQPQRHIASINSRSANSLQAMPRRNRACPSRLGTAACWLAVLLALPAFCPAATNSWIGLGASGNWSDGSNWGTTAPPGTGDTIVFPAGAARPVNTNNLSGTLILSQMQFRGSNYVLYGNALSVTNSIVATNLSGANAINNAITLATADVTMLVSAGTLALNGQLSGSVGVTKTGAGTLLYQYGLNNTYSGSTRVNAGTLQLNVLGTSSFGGPLIIGDGSGTGSPIVQALIGSVISDSASVTVNRGGILDLNTYYDKIGSLTLSGGIVTNRGTGILLLADNSSLTVDTAGSAIYGQFNTGAGACAWSVTSPGWINIFASVGGTANITKSGSGDLYLLSSNYFTGNLTANGSGSFGTASSWGLGATNGGVTMNNQTVLSLMQSVAISNKALFLNNLYGSYGSLKADQGYNTSVWSGPITIGANVSLNTETNASLEVAGAISGTGALTKLGPGTLRFSGPTGNSYSGVTTVNQGTLELNKAVNVGAIPFDYSLVIGDGTGTDTVRLLNGHQLWSVVTPVIINKSGVLDLNGYVDYVAPLTLVGGQITTGAGTVNLDGTIVVVPTNQTAVISGKAALTTSPVVVTNTGHFSSADLRMDASISGSGGLTKTGSGELELTASNSFTGPVVVNQGNLMVANSGALGNTNTTATVNAGGTLTLENNLTIAKPLVLAGTGWSGLGALSTIFGSSSWAGAVTLASDTVIIVSTNGAPGATLTLSGPITGSGALTESGYGTLTFSGTGNNTYGGSTVVSSGTLVLSKSGGVTAVPGPLNLSGKVQMTGDYETAQSSDVTIQPGGVLQTGGHQDYIDALSGSGQVDLGGGGWLVIGTDHSSSTYNGLISGSGTLYKFGGGTITLNGNNTYTGSTLLNGGTLLVNGNQPASSVGWYGLYTAILGGTGVVGNIDAVGTISPGDSPGILTCSNLVFDGAGGSWSSYAVELRGPTPGVDYDQIDARGTVTIVSNQPTLQLTAAFTNPVAVGQQFVIIKNDGGGAVSGYFAGFSQGSSFNFNGYQLTITYTGGDGNDVAFTVTDIPAATTSAVVTGGDGNHGLDPNDCNNLCLVVSNKSGATMAGVKATLSTTTPGVVITQPYSTYPDLPVGGKGTNIAPFQISTLSSFACGTSINLQLSVDSSLGSFTMKSALPSGEPALTASRFDNSTVTSLPDVGSVESTNVVSGIIAPLQKVVVGLYLTHTYDSDLTNISLIAPDGTTVMLSSANGGSGHDYGTTCPTNAGSTIFDDAAPTSITAGSAPFAGSYRPQTPLSALTGNTTPNGYWRLHIADGFGGSLGTLRCWTLLLNGMACTSGSGACDYCSTSITGAITSGDITQTYRISRNGVVGSCGAPKAWPGLSGSAANHCDVYAFTNSSPAEACVTVILSASCDVQAGIYLNAFDPGNLAGNYLADSGNSTFNGPQVCSATIPPGATFFVTVNEVTANAGCASYTLQLSGLPCPPPTLTIAPLIPAGKVRLNWPSWAGGYNLETSGKAGGAPWSPATTTEPIVSAGRYNVTNLIAPTNLFYRLYKP